MLSRSWQPPCISASIPVAWGHTRPVRREVQPKFALFLGVSSEWLQRRQCSFSPWNTPGVRTQGLVCAKTRVKDTISFLKQLISAQMTQLLQQRALFHLYNAKTRTLPSGWSLDHVIFQSSIIGFNDNKEDWLMHGCNETYHQCPCLM